MKRKEPKPKSRPQKTPEAISYLETLHSTIQAVPLARMRVSLNAQRDERPARIAFLTENMNLELLGYPVVNLREGQYWIIDGRHRINALKNFLGEWEGQSVDCRVYADLTEQQEADMFDWLANVLSVSAFDRFKIRVTAGRTVETDVKKVATNCGLKIAQNGGPGTVGAVSTMVRIAQRSDPATLGRSLTIVNESFGDVGLTNTVIDGVARVCERYNGQIEDKRAIETLRTHRGGVGSLMTRAALFRKQYGKSVPECFAAATVDVLNGKRGGKKLPPFWKSGPEK